MRGGGGGEGGEEGGRQGAGGKIEAGDGKKWERKLG